MTPDLITLLLQQSLPVRLSLLDAEPNAPGWMVTAVDDWRLYERPSKQERWGVENGLCAWLPCNPLAIVEHTRALFGDTAFLRVSRVDGRWRMTLMRDDGGDDFTSKAARHECPHTAAIALLRGVVG